MRVGSLYGGFNDFSTAGREKRLEYSVYRLTLRRCANRRFKICRHLSRGWPFDWQPFGRRFHLSKPTAGRYL